LGDSSPSTASSASKPEGDVQPQQQQQQVVEQGGDNEEAEAKRRRRQERWDNVVKAGQDRAIANKKKREPTMDKKRRTFALTFLDS
jgi:hypothetical protein